MTAARHGRLGPRGQRRRPGSPAPGPRSAATRPTPWSPSSAPDADRSTGAGPRVHRPGRRRRAPRPCSSSTGRAGCRPTPTRFDAAARPVVDKLTEKKGPPSGLSQAIGSRVTGAEVGALLGFLGGKVLGQFDPFHEPVRPAAARRAQHRPRRARARRRPHRLPALGLPARGDPPGAVHRGAVDARPPLRARSAGSSETIEPTRLLDDGLKRLSEALKGGRPSGSLLDVLGTPEQREIIDRVTGVMSLLEGHADVVMDGVGPEVIPSVDEIRKKFNQRRKGVGSSTSCCAGCSASTPRWRSTATAPVRPRRRRQGRHGRLQRRLGATPTTCRPRPRSPTPPPGWPASC